VFRVPDVENAPAEIGTLPTSIEFVWVWPSLHAACHVKVMLSAELDVAVKEMGRPWLVVPT